MSIATATRAGKEHGVDDASSGGSPIMAGNGDEAEDLARLQPTALVINIGSFDPGSLQHYLKSLKAYNRAGRSVLLDPVGGGATSLRRSMIKTLLRAGHFAVIKGNEGEIHAVWGQRDQEQQRGVDSGASNADETSKVRLVMDLARREKCVVLMTGRIDYLSDGTRTIAIGNGHEYLGWITGSGCALGTVITCCLAVAEKDPMLATLAGTLMYEIAAERAAANPRVSGPGSFVPAFIDELAEVAGLATRSDQAWLNSPKIRRVDLGMNRVEDGVMREQ